MKYINKYADLAAYTADTNRPTEAKTVSKVAQNLRYEGKNIVVDKAYCAYGDTVVFDKNDGKAKVVKLDTLNRATLGSNYDIKGVICDRDERTGYAVSLNYATSAPWGAPYKVKVTGFDLATGGSFTITVNSTTTSAIVYTTSDTLTTIATSMMAALQAAGFTAATGWSCTARVAQNCIVVQQSWHTPNVITFLITDADSKVTRAILTGNYQTALSGLVPALGSIRRADGVDSSFAGNNFAKFKLRYSASGDDSINQAVGASTIIKESRFNAVDNPLLVSYYVTYDNYLMAKLARHPFSKGAITRDAGIVDTKALAAIMYPDYDDSYKPGYPAAYNAFTYGVPSEGYTTGFEAGNWYLESVRRMFLLMKDLTYGLPGITTSNADPINRSLYAAGGTTISVADYPWTSTESSGDRAWIYGGDSVGSTNKNGTNLVRPVTAFPLR